jgi:hypothetical protein
MSVFGNNIKNPYSTDHPHDPKVKSLAGPGRPKKFNKLSDLMGTKKFADGGIVDPSAPVDDGTSEPRPYSEGGMADAYGMPTGEPTRTLEPQRFAEGGEVQDDYTTSMNAAKYNKMKGQLDDLLLRRDVDQELADKYPIQDKPPQNFAFGGAVDPTGSLPVAGRKQRTGTGFVNLQKIMGGASGKKLGEAVGSGITSGAEQVKGQLGTEQSQYGQQLSTASKAFDPEARDKAIAEAGTGTTEDQTKAFEKYRSGKLGEEGLAGGLKGYGELSSKASDVAQQGKDIESQAGRYNLLQRYASGGKQYTAGGKRLDAMLMGQGGGQALQQARLATGGIGTQLQKGQEGALAQYGKAAGEAKQFGQETEQKLSGAGQEIEKAVDFPTKQAAAQKEYQDTQAAIQKMTETGEVDPAIAARLGLTEGTDLYNLNPAELTDKLQASKMTSASQYSTPEQAARMAALMKLSGKDINQSNWGTGKGGEAAAEAAKSQADLLSGSKELMAKKAADYETAKGKDIFSGYQGWADSQGGYTEARAEKEQASNLANVKDKLAKSGMSAEQQQEVLDSYSGKYGVANANYDPAAMARYNAAMGAYDTAREFTPTQVPQGTDEFGNPQMSPSETNAEGQTLDQWNAERAQRSSDKNWLEGIGGTLRERAGKLKEYETDKKGKKLTFKK